MMYETGHFQLFSEASYNPDWRNLSMRKRKRPFGVTIIALLLLLNGLLAAVRGGLLAREFYQEEQGTIEPEDVARFSEDWSVIEWLAFPLTVAGIVMAWGMWTLNPRAWFATMALQGLHLTAQLYDYIQGDPHYINMITTLATVFYLNTRDVQIVFRPPKPKKPVPHPIHAED
jgi:hypothetical protein